MFFMLQSALEFNKLLLLLNMNSGSGIIPHKLTIKRSVL